MFINFLMITLRVVHTHSLRIIWGRLFFLVHPIFGRTNKSLFVAKYIIFSVESVQDLNFWLHIQNQNTSLNTNQRWVLFIFILFFQNSSSPNLSNLFFLLNRLGAELLVLSFCMIFKCFTFWTNFSVLWIILVRDVKECLDTFSSSSQSYILI